MWAGNAQAAHSRAPVYLELYDDLQPGRYRITLFFRLVAVHWTTLAPLTRGDRALRLTLALQPGAAQPTHPQLPEARLLRIALAAAARAGDPRPTLIQHAAGTHFKTVLVGSEGDTVNDWHWSYLIAIRGHFRFGSVITLVVDASTGEITDSGGVPRYPDLAKLGKVTTDLRR